MCWAVWVYSSQIPYWGVTYALQGAPDLTIQVKPAHIYSSWRGIVFTNIYTPCTLYFPLPYILRWRKNWPEWEKFVSKGGGVDQSHSLVQKSFEIHKLDSSYLCCNSKELNNILNRLSERRGLVKALGVYNEQVRVCRSFCYNAEVIFMMAEIWEAGKKYLRVSVTT